MTTVDVQIRVPLPDPTWAGSGSGATGTGGAAGASGASGVSLDPPGNALEWQGEDDVSKHAKHGMTWGEKCRMISDASDFFGMPF